MLKIHHLSLISIFLASCNATPKNYGFSETQNRYSSHAYGESLEMALTGRPAELKKFFAKSLDTSLDGEGSELYSAALFKIASKLGPSNFIYALAREDPKVRNAVADRMLNSLRDSSAPKILRCGLEGLKIEDS